MMLMVTCLLAALTVACLVVLALGLNRALVPVDDVQTRRRVVAVFTGIIAAWLALTAVLAVSGFLSDWHARPPRVPLIPIIAVGMVLSINFAPLVRRVLLKTNRALPVAFQSFRIGVELSFWGLFASGGAPVQVTFEGKNFDVLVGLSAPFMALAIAKFNIKPRVVIGWNVLGLVILGNTVVTALTSMPGPLHRDWPGAPFVAFATWPFVWVPAFLAPLAIFLHVFSIRQNILSSRLQLAQAPLRQE